LPGVGEIGSEAVGKVSKRKPLLLSRGDFIRYIYGLVKVFSFD
jgi:hypothetical protein